MAEEEPQSLAAVVGDTTYGVWTEMLKHIVPDGRTHRLRVVVAGMLEFARDRADEHEDAEKEGSVAHRLRTAVEKPNDARNLLIKIVQQLFRDAGVKWKRKSRRGEQYSIADDAIEEYVDWELMPWE